VRALGAYGATALDGAVVDAPVRLRAEQIPRHAARFVTRAALAPPTDA